MSPDEITIKRSVLNELRSLLKRMDAETMDSELNPPVADMPVELITPEPTQADPAPMPNPNELDPEALAKLEEEEVK